MRIAHLIDTVSDNGVTRVVLTLVRAMRCNGDDVTLAVCRDPDGNSNAGGDTVDYSVLPLGNLESRTKLFGSRICDMHYARQDSKVLDQWVVENGIDFIFIHGLLALRFFKVTIPHAIVIHNTKSKMLLPSPWSPARPLLLSLYRKVYRERPIVAVSDGARLDLIKHFGAKQESSKTICNPFEREVIRQLANEHPDDLLRKPYFVAAGRAVRAKRFDVLIRAFAASEVDVDLVILGQGRKFDDYRKLANRLGVGSRVHFPGFRSNPYPYFKQASAMVLASDYEGYPTGMVEALICGTPVISTDCPSGPREALGERYSAYLAPTGDVDSLARTMRKVIEEPYVYPETFLDRFEPQRIASDYKKFADQQC